MARKYYGIRFFSSNRECTMGDPHPKTGRCSKASAIEVFRTKADLDEWLDSEKLTAPSGLDGGARISANKADCRKQCLGMSVQSFEEMLEQNEMFRYDID